MCATGAVVRQCFTRVETADFATSATVAPDLLTRQPEVERVLKQLEAKL